MFAIIQSLKAAKLDLAPSEAKAGIKTPKLRFPKTAQSYQTLAEGPKRALAAISLPSTCPIPMGPRRLMNLILATFESDPGNLLVPVFPHDGSVCKLVAGPVILKNARWFNRWPS